MAKDYTKYRKTDSDRTNGQQRSVDMYNIKSPYRKSSDGNRIENIPVDSLVPFQGGTPFNDYIGSPKFETLVRDIEENGVLTPIIVRELPDGKYEVLAGRHRSEAQKYLHRATVPAEIYPAETPDDKAMLIHLNTNLLQGRQEMTLIERIKALVAYESTLDKLKGKRSDRQNNGEKYDRYQQLTDVFGIGGRSTTLMYLKIGKEIPDDILHKIDISHLSATVAYKILGLEDEFKEQVYTYLREGNKLTMPQLDTLIAEYKKTGTEKSKAEKIEEEPISESVLSSDDESYEGFQTAEDYNFSDVAQAGAPLSEKQAEQNTEKKDAESTKKESTLKAKDFDNVLKNSKLKKFCSLKLDKMKLPPRFTSLEDDKKAELVISLIKRWDNDLNDY